MSTRGSFEFWLVVAAALPAVACGPQDYPPPPNDPICSGALLAHAPGELVAGEDPAVLMAPYWGNYTGTLSWLKGGTTPFTLSLAPSSDTNAYAENCPSPPTVYAYADLGFTTEDGGLDEADSADLLVPLPDAKINSSYSTLGPGALADWQWQGDITPHLPSDSTSYTERVLVPVIDWPLGTQTPSAMRFYFEGRLLGAMVRDKMLVASVTFP